MPSQRARMLRIGQETDRQMDRRGRREMCAHRVSCDVRAYVSCRGYAGIPLRVQVFPVKQGGTADFKIRP